MSNIFFIRNKFFFLFQSDSLNLVELDESKVIYKKTLGKGNFGEVYHGYLTRPSEVVLEVAIKVAIICLIFYVHCAKNIKMCTCKTKSETKR